ncbi:Hypothetical protein PBC10988_33960 [Planctomycetales bacterium 10988]|nr:Hypothetical protein PBC10988_33960 [Planctomycetales bacterium 10988]
MTPATCNPDLHPEKTSLEEDFPLESPEVSSRGTAQLVQLVEDAIESSDKETALPKGGNRWFGRRFFSIAGGLLGMGAFLWFLPPMAEEAGMQNQIVKLMFADIHGEVSASGGELAWNTPVVLYDLQVQNDVGEVIFITKEFRLQRTFGELVFNQRNSGPVYLKEPVATVSFYEGGCDYADIFGDWHKKRSAGKTLKDLQIHIEQGVLEIVLPGEQRWRMEPFDFKLWTEEETPGQSVLSADVKLLDPVAELKLAGVFDHKKDFFDLSKIYLAAPEEKLALDASATIENVEREGKFNLEGILDYDLALFDEALIKEAGIDLQLAGKGPQPFSFAGYFNPKRRPDYEPPTEPTVENPVDVHESLEVAEAKSEEEVLESTPEEGPILQSPQGEPIQGDVALDALPEAATPTESTATENPAIPTEPVPDWAQVFSGSFDFAFEHINLKGFHAGPGVLPLRFEYGWLAIQPTHIPFNGGMLHLAGGVYLAGDSPLLVLKEGLIAENIEITPEMCERGMQYIAPVVAEAADATGRFSVALDACRIPLDTPEQGELAGRVLVHSVDMGMSPMVADIASILQVPPTFRLVRDSEITFYQQDGKIFHRGLVFAVGSMVIETEGSVRMADDRLDMVAYMTPPVDWLPNGPLGNSLKSMRITIPIQGTLDDPVIGKPNMGDLPIENLGDTAEDILGQILDGNGPLRGILGRDRRPPPGAPLPEEAVPGDRALPQEEPFQEPPPRRLPLLQRLFPR